MCKTSLCFVTLLLLVPATPTWPNEVLVSPGGQKGVQDDLTTSFLAAAETGTTRLPRGSAIGPVCAAGEGCQIPDQAGHSNVLGATSDLNPGYRVGDDFTALVDGAITQVCWWGFYIDFSGPEPSECSPGTGDVFAATYYNDMSEHRPGTVRAGPLPITLTSKFDDGFDILGGLFPVDEYQFEGTHEPVPVQVGECYWIEITNTTIGDCHWLWVTAPGDCQSFQDVDSNGYEPVEQEDFDLAWCIDVPAESICAPYQCNAEAGSPPNDCYDPQGTSGQSGAMLIELDIEQPVVMPFDNTQAMTDGLDVCGGPCDFGGEFVQKDLWYVMQAPCTGTLTASTCLSAQHNTRIAAYDIPGPTPGDLPHEPIACNDNCAEDATYGTSKLVIDAQRDNWYLIRLGSSAGGAGEISFEFEAGFFDAPVFYASAANAKPVGWADLDADGDQDLVVGTATGLSLSLNNGDGTYPPEVPYPTGTSQQDVVVGDLDADSDFDVAMVGGAVGVRILFNNGYGIFGSQTSFGPWQYTHLAVGDLDADLDLDLIATRIGSPLNVSVFFNNGNGTFGGPTSYGVAGIPTNVAVGQLDADADLDLAVANGGGVAVFLNSGTGTFAAPVQYAAGSGSHFVAIGDLDGIPGNDLAVANYAGASISVLLNNGSGAFAAGGSFPAGDSPAAVSVGDLNADLDPDLAVAGASGLSVLLNNGDGTFAPPESYSPPASLLDVALVDLDPDLSLDVVVTTIGGVSVFMNQPYCLPPPCPADLNGDGTVDAADLAQLLGRWGLVDDDPPGDEAADFDANGAVNAADLALLLGSWGPC